jgi:hypothetical protein
VIGRLMSTSRLLKATLLVILLVPNIILAQWSIDAVLRGDMAVDWVQYVEAGRRVWDGELYGSTASYGWRYSPILAVAFTAIGLVGTSAWRLLHFAAVFAMPNWRLALATVISWPFWFDVETGNTMVFVLLAAAWAISGSRVGTFAFLALTLLIPRPLMLPVAIWLLWSRPEWRLPFATMFAVHGVLVLASGWGPEWVAELLWTPTIYTSPSNVGPSRFIGLAWLIVGIPLAGYLTWKGRLGLASLAISPYLLPYYLIMGLLELIPSGRLVALNRRMPEAAIQWQGSR